ncbi:hypothetical protein ABEB36_003401 [Hypothenemus hampei]|uniref:JNK1/MAPK8-associated membrane protein n=1 Tax=Hypothenemus hampei TaxID=57062 RepID=A0ABD1F9R3_HYPHA
MSCPGLYCGRTILENGEFSDCGSCERGYRRNETSFICEPCLDQPVLYDWLFLGFLVLVVLILHWFFIDLVSMKRSFCKNVLVLHASAVVEVFLAAVIAILCMKPFGSFTVHTCRSRSLSDWYTLMHNPRPNFEDKIYCTQEAVFPMYTIVFLFYVLALIVMLTIRPWICRKFLPRQGKMSIYSAMYFIPILILTHAVIGGLIYYSYPYLTIVISIISCAAHFAGRMEQTIRLLLIRTFGQPRNLFIVIGHWCLHAYGIISLTQLTRPILHGLLLLLVPIPALFYIFTTKFTDPVGFH